MHDTITKAIADRWAGEKCHLNGAPSKITGRLNKFATIAPLNIAIASVEFNWHTVNRVMLEKGGFFEV